VPNLKVKNLWKFASVQKKEKPPKNSANFKSSHLSGMAVAINSNLVVSSHRQAYTYTSAANLVTFEQKNHVASNGQKFMHCSLC